MEQRIRILVSSDPDYEDLVAEITFDDVDCLAIVSQEEGFASLDVEILPRKDGQHWKLKYDLLISLLEKARDRLGDLQRRIDVSEEPES